MQQYPGRGHQRHHRHRTGEGSRRHRRRQGVPARRRRAPFRPLDRHGPGHRRADRGGGLLCRLAARDDPPGHLAGQPQLFGIDAAQNRRDKDRQGRTLRQFHDRSIRSQHVNAVIDRVRWYCGHGAQVGQE